MSPHRQAAPVPIARRHCARVDNTEPTSEVVGAGTIPWRVEGNELQVLMVHRPDRRGWSWPKGKIKTHETVPACAVRETEEETGLIIRLGIPLPVVRGKKRETWYWAAEIQNQLPVADRQEIDKVRWFDVDTARTKLNSISDRAPLEALIEAHRANRLATVATLFLPHAKPVPESKWSKAEADRPLTHTGLRQALDLAELAGAWNPQTIFTSPWQRCLQTVTAYAEKFRPRLRRKNWLRPDRAAKDPRRTRRKLSEQLTRNAVRDQDLLVCTHPEVIDEVVTVLREATPPKIFTRFAAHFTPEGLELPAGTLLVAQLATGVDHARVVSLEVFGIFED